MTDTQDSVYDGLLPGQDHQAHQAHQPVAHHSLMTVPIRQVNLPPGAEHGIHFTVLASTTFPSKFGNGVQLLLGRDYNRAEAVIRACDQPVILASTMEQAQAAVAAGGQLPAGASPLSIALTGSATDPAANTNIINLTGLTNGVDYSVEWATGLEGTVTAADANNMELSSAGIGGNLVAIYPGAIGGPYQQLTVTGSPSATSLQVKAVAAASGASAVYWATIVATPQNPAAGVLALPPGGQYLPAGADITLRHCDQVWLAAVSAVAGRVSVAVSLTGEKKAPAHAAHPLH